MFKVGDEVVCVDAIECPSLKAGNSYVISAQQFVDCLRCKKGGSGVQLREIPDVQYCPCGHLRWFQAWRFVKLPKLTVDQEDVAMV